MKLEVRNLIQSFANEFTITDIKLKLRKYIYSFANNFRVIQINLELYFKKPQK